MQVRHPAQSDSIPTSLVFGQQHCDFHTFTLAFQISFYLRLVDLLALAAARVPDLSQEIHVPVAMKHDRPRGRGTARVYPGGHHKSALVVRAGDAEGLLPESAKRITAGRQ